MSGQKILLIEAFYGGSHKQLIDLIAELNPNISDLFVMTAKKWHWRNITSPLHFANIVPKEHDYRILFTSSVLPLAEFVALRPDVMKLYKIVYFHENQLEYPVRKKKDRYFQHGYNDILTCLVADKILFNSNFNKESFLGNISKFFNILPDYTPKNLDQKVRDKCEVVYYPINIEINVQGKSEKFCSLHNCIISNSECNFEKKLHIVWPHRWEHDKDPETFFSILYRLKDSGENFHISVIGETFTEKPIVFDEAKESLKANILHWGYQENKSDYYKILKNADVVVSTARHEFFGVSMLEALYFGCFPLCPNKLAYPELYLKKYLYNTPNQLYKRLKYFCKNPKAARNHKIEMDLSKFSWQEMKTKYKNIFAQAMA